MSRRISGRCQSFTKSYDFLAWLVPTTNNFPRAHRYAGTQRLLDAAFSF
ncbi:MAG: four helix bundle protein [Caldilinea sp.]|nr:four helix bundle protein [Caldilinea sp.]